MQPPITRTTAPYWSGDSVSPRNQWANRMVSAGYAADSVPTMVIGPAMIDRKYMIQPAPSRRYASTPMASTWRPSAANTAVWGFAK